MNKVDVARHVARRFIEEWDARAGRRGFQNDFARLIGINQGTVSGWIAAMRYGEPPKIESLARLCDGLGVPIASLFPPPGPLASRVQEDQASKDVADLARLLARAHPETIKTVRAILEEELGAPEPHPDQKKR